MKFLFSPSKGMKYKNINFTGNNFPKFNKETDILIKKLKTLSKDEIQNLFKVKGAILESTYKNIQDFYINPAKEAISFYDGVSYKQLEVESFKNDDFNFINENVFIFSALYGIINGLDLIKEYRLDMTIKVLEESPYKFWEKNINDYLNDLNDIFINFASKEFSKIVNRKNIKVIDVEFRQEVNGILKNISTEAKKARGSFLNYCIKNKVQTVDDLKNISINGYTFESNLSTENLLVFKKKELA